MRHPSFVPGTHVPGPPKPPSRKAPQAALVGLLLLLPLTSGCFLFQHLDGGGAFSGRVVDGTGDPVSGARVEVNRRATESGADGSFRLAVPPAPRYLLHVSHPDYASDSHLSRVPLRDQTWTLVRAQVETFDPTVPITLEDTRPELAAAGLAGAVIELPPNSLVDAAGQPPAGQVRGAIATLDLANGEGPNDWGVRASDGSEGYLVSYGAVFVEFTDPGGGTTYQLRPGSLADVSLPVLPSMGAHTGAAPTAPFWYWDEADGYWKENGNAVWNAAAGAYVGQVDHLSFINTDIAKFDAACLKVTLDSSVATGHSLRVRYHSGGTAFGQVPQFTLADTDNAAYRLPANTNVLLELFTSGGDPVGNLVVEDPAGNPLVNTVVNTGPPLPPGADLWPLPPYNTCKPIVLKLGDPEVEIRINELPAEGAPRDNPSDDYLTWAPTYSRARLATPMGSGVTVVLTNDPAGAIAGGGNVRFATHQDPWPANTTATATSLTLTLPADGSWVPFMVAGEFGSSSENDKDTIIEAHQGTAAGPVIGTKALMVRVRKDANTLTASERDRFLFAWQKFRNQVGTNYVLFQEMHRLANSAGDEAHGQPAFFTWHRAMLLQVERELQKIDPSVALHYWDWDAAAPNVFSEDFMGRSDTSAAFLAEPIFSMTNPLNGWNTDLYKFNDGDLMRRVNDQTVDPGSEMRPLDEPAAPVDLMDQDDYSADTTSFSTSCFSGAAEWFSHNPGHTWPCASGHLQRANRSAADPLFYLLHSQVDRQWAYWQEEKGRFGVVSGGNLTFPVPSHYDSVGAFDTPANVPSPDNRWDFRQKGSYLEDGLWPWDGTSGGTAGSVEERPVNHTPSQDEGVDNPDPNVPETTPIIPMTSFPASPRANLWPPAATVPTNADMIDYHGRFRLQDGLGFSYDDVPY